MRNVRAISDKLAVVMRRPRLPRNTRPWAQRNQRTKVAATSALLLALSSGTLCGGVHPQPAAACDSTEASRVTWTWPSIRAYRQARRTLSIRRRVRPGWAFVDDPAEQRSFGEDSPASRP